MARKPHSCKLWPSTAPAICLSNQMVLRDYEAQKVQCQPCLSLIPFSVYCWRNVLNKFKFALGEVGCLENQFTCGNKRCTANSLTCNGVNNCGDNSDEILPCERISCKISKYCITKPKNNGINKESNKNHVLGAFSIIYCHFLCMCISSSSRGENYFYKPTTHKTKNN